MRWILGLVVAAAIGVGGWVLLRSDGADEAPTDEALPRSKDDERRAVTLAGAKPSGRVDGKHAGRGGLVVLVLRDGKPAKAEVEARFLAGPERIYPNVRDRDLGWKLPFMLPDPLGSVAAHGASDEEGRSFLSNLGAGIYRVTARGPDGTRGASNVALPVDGARSLVTIELVVSSLVLEGKVEWSDGRPFTGTVVLQPESERRGSTLRGRVGSEGSIATPLAADGTFRLEGLAAGRHMLRAILGDGLFVANDVVTLPAAERFRMVVDAGSLPVKGRVLDGVSETPIAGATLVVHSTKGQGPWSDQLLTSDAEGRFRVNVIGLPAQLHVEAPGYGRADRAADKADEEVVLRLLKTARIVGRVTTKDGGLASGAVVVARSAGLSPGVEQSTVTDAEGRFAFEAVPSGEVTVMVCGGGWISAGLLEAKSNGYNPFLHGVAAGTSLALDLTAVPGARIEGRVLDAAGSPVGGAIVRAAPASSSPFDDARGIAGDLGDFATTSDAQGAFALDGLIPELPCRVTALAPEQALASAGPLSLAVGEPVHVELRFPTPRFVDVQVLFEGDGAPVAGARATLLGAGVHGSVDWFDRRRLSAPDTWTLGTDGRARLGPAPVGALYVRVEGDDVAGSEIRMTSPGQRAPPGSFPVEGSAEGAGPFALTVRIPRGLTIEGRVMRHDGTPAVRASVSAHREGAWQSQTADAEGVFVLRGLAAGAWTVSAAIHVEAQAYLRATTTADAGARGLTLTLSEKPVTSDPMEGEGGGPTLVVRVVDDRGRPVPAAQVSVQTGGGGSGGDVRDGVARIDLGQIARHGARESLVVRVWGARGQDGLPLPLGPARVGPLAAGQLETDVQLPAEHALEGRVLTESGEVVPGVQVTARLVDTEDRFSLGPTSTGRTDAQGLFRVGGLAEGEHSLEFAVSPEFLAPAPMTAATGSTDTVVRLKVAASARVRVLDDAGQPLAGARVAVELPMPQPVAGQDMRPLWDAWNRIRERLSANALTGPDGTARLRGLSTEHRVRLGVTPPTGREDLQPLSQDDWTPSDLEVSLLRGYLVSGVVRDGEGRPVPNAQVERQTHLNGWTGTQAKPDGTFRFTGIPSGPVTLRARGPSSAHGRGSEPAQVTVPAGSQDVVLRIDPGVNIVVRVTNLDEADWKAKGEHVASAMVLRGERWEHAGWAWDQVSVGQFRFEGMNAAEKYRVWIQPRKSEWYGLAMEVTAGAGEVAVQLKRGGTIRGRVTAPKDAQHVNVQLTNDQGLGSGSDPVDIEGRYEIRGLPEGRWTVNAYGRVKDRGWQATGTAATGGTLDLTLQESPR